MNLGETHIQTTARVKHWGYQEHLKMGYHTDSRGIILNIKIPCLIPPCTCWKTGSQALSSTGKRSEIGNLTFSE